MKKKLTEWTQMIQDVTAPHQIFVKKNSIYV